jgi:hypothetical protein
MLASKRRVDSWKKAILNGDFSAGTPPFIGYEVGPNEKCCEGLKQK